MAIVFLNVCVAVMLAGATASPSPTPFTLKAMMKVENTAEIEKEFWAISTPGNPKYLEFKTIDQLRSLIGTSPASIDRTIAYFTGLGANKITVSPLKDFVEGEFDESVKYEFNNEHPTDVEFIIRNDVKIVEEQKQVPNNINASKPQAQYSIGEQKKAYGIPLDLEASNESTLQMVWGPGTFGYSKAQLIAFKLSQCPKLNMDKIKFDTKNHGTPGGDNYGEGNLDISMIASFGLNVETIVSNTNTSASTEEGKGFGQAMLDFVVDLPNRQTIPQVLSISLGSLSAYSCDLLCEKVVAKGRFSQSECNDFLQQQRQVCMYISEPQIARINLGFQILGMRGVSVFGSSGDGGSHWSFEAFPDDTPIGKALNVVGCEYQFPVYPTGSPYVTSVGGTVWGTSPKDPIAWDRSGGGFAGQFPAPAHQKSTVASYIASTTGLPPASSYNATNRAYPDISSISVEGTSESSPATAGIFSMVMDHRLNAGLPPLGFLGPRLYQTMEAHPGSAFQDVTEGNSKTNCDNGFPATKGWDPVTGWGRPVWSGMLQYFGSDSHLN